VQTFHRLLLTLSANFLALFIFERIVSFRFNPFLVKSKKQKVGIVLNLKKPNRKLLKPSNFLQEAVDNKKSRKIPAKKLTKT
jgi:hypothetical protein